MIRITTLIRFAVLVAVALTACQAVSTQAPVVVSPTVTVGQPSSLVTATQSMDPTPAIVIHDVALGESATIAGETFSITNWDWVPFGMRYDNWTNEPSIIIQLSPSGGSNLDDWQLVRDGQPAEIHTFSVAIEDATGQVLAQAFPGQVLTDYDGTTVFFQPWLNIPPGKSIFDGTRVMNVIGLNVAAQAGLILRIDYAGERHRMALGDASDLFRGQFDYRDELIKAYSFGATPYDVGTLGSGYSPAEAAAAQATVDAMNLRGERVLVAVPTATPFPFPVVEPTRGSPYVAESEHAAIYARVVEAVVCWGAVTDDQLISRGVAALEDCALEPPMDESGDCFNSDGLACLFQQARDKGWYPRLIVGVLAPWSEMSQVAGTHMGFYDVPKAGQPFQVEFNLYFTGVRLEAISLSDGQIIKAVEPVSIDGSVLWEDGSWGRVIFDWKAPAVVLRWDGLLPTR